MTIDPQLPVWLVGVLLVAVLIFSTVLEWRRPLRFRWLRLMSCLVAVISLAFIFLRPSYMATTDREAILLTKGFNRHIADSLRRVFPKADFYHLGEAGYRNSKMLMSYRDIIHNYEEGSSEPGPGNIRAIVGEGLPSYALDSIRGGFLYFPPTKVNGITSIQTPLKNAVINEVATISGTFETDSKGTTLYFSGPSGKLDSLPMNTGRGNFSFAFTPRVPGRVNYSLTIADSLDNLTVDNVPLIVQPFSPLNILMLQAHPTFDMQHLKNFLSDRHHRVAMRAQLSRNITRTEFANRESISLNRLTVPLLDAFDVIIVDPSTISNLTPAERAALETSLKNGLGMIVVFTDEPTKSLSKDLLPVSFGRITSDTTSVMVNGKRFALPAARMKPEAFEGTVVSKERSRPLSGYAPMRKGMAGFQLLRETYSILMSGDSIAYGLLWSPLISGVARPKASRGSIQLVSSFPSTTNEPLRFDIISSTTPALFADSSRIPAAEDVIIDDVWHATVWADRKGWHEVRTEEDTLSYYIFDDNDWKALRLNELRQTTYRAGLRPAITGNGKVEMRPVPLAPFFIAFLMAVGFLWLAPKL